MDNQTTGGMVFGSSFICVTTHERELSRAAKRAEDVIGHVWLLCEADGIAVYSVLIPIQENRRHSSQHYVAFKVNADGLFFVVCDCQHFTFRNEAIAQGKTSFCVHVPVALEMHEWRINTGTLFTDINDFFPERRILQPAVREFDALERAVFGE